MAAPFEPLRKEKYLSLVTRRKSGKEVATPMWFIVEGDRIYMRTGARSAKVKRIRHDGRVWLALCTPSGRETGPRMEAQAAVGDPLLLEAVNRGLQQKYGFMKRIVDLINRMRGITEIALLEIKALS